MEIRSGFLYHIKDSFFDDVKDHTLMSNKEGGSYRPHFLAIQDTQNSEIFWMVPVSSKFSKYKKIYESQIRKYKKCTKIVLGKCGGWDAAYLIQNAFPIIPDYFDHIHISQGQALTIHDTTQKRIMKNLNYNLRLHKRDVSLFFADIDRIYTLMETLINKRKAI